MNYLEFYNKYIGRAFPDTDGVFGTQCVDLPKSYIQEVWGENYGPMYGNGGAKEAYLLFPNSLITTSEWDRLPNTPDFIPNQGDIIVFDATVGNPYGHIGVVHEANLNTVTVFNTNWRNKNAELNVFDYANPRVLGFLRHKQKPQPVLPVVEVKEVVKYQDTEETLTKVSGLEIENKWLEKQLLEMQNKPVSVGMVINDTVQEQKPIKIEVTEPKPNIPQIGDFIVDMNKIKETYFKAGGLEGTILGVIGAITAYLYLKQVIGYAEVVLIGGLASGIAPLIVAKVGRFWNKIK